MDIYKFLRSFDVAEYCKKIGHIFNPIEMAYLIENSEITINEKNILFQELIDCYPNMYFHESVNFQVQSSLHDYLRALIEWNKSAIEFFYHFGETQDSFVYTLSEYNLGELGLVPKMDPIKGFMRKATKYKSFKTVKELLEDIRPLWNREKMRSARIFVKRIRARTNFEFYADVNFEGEVIGLNTSRTVDGGEYPGNLSNLFVHIPVPFQVGDIVSSSYEKGNIPYVLKSLPHSAKKNVKNISGVDFRYYLSVADAPKCATIYYITKDGHLADSFPYFHNNSPWSQGWGWDTDCLQFYTGQFEGAAEALLPLSEYIKKNGIKKVPEWAKVTCKTR